MGLSRIGWEATRPALERENAIAFQVWKFCGGWNPALVPVAAAYYEVDDVDLLITQLLAIRESIENYQKAAAEADKGGPRSHL